MFSISMYWELEHRLCEIKIKVNIHDLINRTTSILITYLCCVSVIDILVQESFSLTKTSATAWRELCRFSFLSLLWVYRLQFLFIHVSHLKVRKIPLNKSNGKCRFIYNKQAMLGSRIHYCLGQLSCRCPLTWLHFNSKSKKHISWWAGTPSCPVAIMGVYILVHQFPSLFFVCA